MTESEATRLLAVINSSWSSKPLDEIAARVWVSKLVKHDAHAVMRVISRLIETEKWRPSLAQILEPLLVKPNVKTAAAAFESVWSQIGKRERDVTDLEARAVKRLGGWSALGMWELDERHWHSKRFVEVYDELVVGERSDELRELAAGEGSKALRAAGGNEG
jgi:hypothetical protein